MLRIEVYYWKSDLSIKNTVHNYQTYSAFNGSVTLYLREH